MNKISNISHVYFTGGGLKGICYLGIIRYFYLEQIEHNVKHVIGTSIGAFFGIIFALKIPIEVIEPDLADIVKNIKKHLTIDQHNLSNLFTKNGIFALDFMMNPIIKWIKTKYDVDDMTFIEFAKRTGVNLYINCISVNTSKQVQFSTEATPNVSVIQAVRASMSIPLMFEPILIDDEYYTDGIISTFEMMTDINKENKLIILLPSDSDLNCVTYPKKKQFDFLEYFLRINETMVNLIQVDLPESDEVFHIKDLPYASYMKFDCNEKDIYVNITNNDMDNLIIQGFVDFAIYMKKRYKV